jgi:HD-GYP domain-containing protein (c-di-GMP phosphodiesterase class II)
MTTTARNRLALQISERRAELVDALVAAHRGTVISATARSLYRRIERAITYDDVSPIVTWFRIAGFGDSVSALEICDHVTDALLAIVNVEDALELRNLMQRARRAIPAALGGVASPDDATVDVRVSATIDGLIAALRARDEVTSIHSCQTGFLAERLLKHMGIAGDVRTLIVRAATLHDIGKLGVPDAVLTKPGALDALEWRLMQRHAQIGKELLLEIPVLADIAATVGSHHERLDGFGYPDGLAGDEIDFATRVVSVVDAFHAMTSDRPYRRALGYGDAVRILRAGAGTQWDGDVVNAMIELAMNRRDAGVGADLLHLSDEAAAYHAPSHVVQQTERA